MSFDSFLCSNGQSDSGTPLTENTSISPTDIRDWCGDTTSGVQDERTLFQLAAERRTKLWTIMLQVQRSLNTAEQDNKAESSLLYTLCPTSPAPHMIPLQQTHRSPYAIPADLADRPSTQFTAESLLSGINSILHTSVPFSRAKKLMERILDKRYDFGMAYAISRRRWPPDELPDGFASLYPPACAPAYRSGHQTAVTDTYGPPRRVWDIYSNRVIPYRHPWFGHMPDTIARNVWAVSHSWVADEDRHLIVTPINRGKWPIPMPKTTTLDHIRIELLNMGAEYVFLDVLCLRQDDGENERERRDEWGRDVPALGYVYRHDRYQTVITYFSGLGLPFSLQRSDIESPFHWLNRAWTIQEATLNWLPGGLTTNIEGISSMGADFMKQLDATLAVTAVEGPSLAELLDVFSRRPGYTEKKPYDQIAALSYLLPHNLCREYSEKYDSVEAAWNDLVVILRGSDLLYLLTCCPYPRRLFDLGDRRSWWPSWMSLLKSPIRAPPPSGGYADHEHLRIATLDGELPTYYDTGVIGNDTHLDYHSAYILQGCCVDSGKGKLMIPTDEGQKTFGFTMFVNMEAKDEEFTLVGLAKLECWVVCRAGSVHELLHYNQDGQEERSEMLALEKITVGRIADRGDRQTILQLNLGRTRLVYYTFRVYSSPLPRFFLSQATQTSSRLQDSD